MRGVHLGTQGDGQDVWMPDGLRSMHLHVIGATGSGKTKFLEHLIRQDIKNGAGLCLVDPTGNLYRDLLRWCETHGYLDRRKIRLFEPSFRDMSFGFNPLLLEDRDDPATVNFLVGTLISAFAQVWGGEDPNKTPLLQRLLRAVLYVLVEQGLTLAEADWLVSSQDTRGVRRSLTSRLRDPGYQREWDDLNAMRPREFEERFMSVQNRLNKFVRSPLVRSVLGQQERVVDTRALMDRGEVLLCSFAVGNCQIPEEDARLLGMLLVNDLLLKARGRPKGSRPFYVYIDECYAFLNQDTALILDQMRQFGLHLILAHQHLGQLDIAGPRIKDSVLTNARTKVVFGGLSMESATVMGDDLFAGELDLEAPKVSLIKPTVVGNEVRWMRNETAGVSEGTALGESEGMSEHWAETEGESYQLVIGSGHSTSHGSSYEPSLFGVLGSNIHYSDSQTFSSQTTEAQGTSYSSMRGGATSRQTSRVVSRGTNRGEGRSQTLVPVYQDLPTAVYSLEEQRYLAAARLRNLPQQEAIVKVPFGRSVHITVPYIAAGYARAERVDQFRLQAFRESGVVAEREAVEAELRARADALVAAVSRRPDEAEASDDPDDFLQ